jgi:TP901 family phage tail tape measure protein
MSNVATIVDTTQVDLQGLATEVLTLNPALGDATELTQGLYQAFSAGAGTAEEAMKTTTDAAMFAKAALTDTFTAVDVLTTAVNAYGRETINTTQASDIFFKTIQFGKVTGDQLASTIGQSIPLFASSGIALEELASGIAAMTKQGVSAANATTQLNAIVNSFLKPSQAMTEALEEMGYASGSAFLEAEGLAGALRLVEERTDGDAAAMSALMPNIRALRGAMALTGVGGEEFTNTLEAMGDAAGATEEAFNKQEKTFETLRNSTNNLLTVVGNVGKVFVDEIAVGATQATQAMIQFLLSSEGMNVVSNIIGGLAGAFELVKTIAVPLIETMRDVWGGVFETIRDALADITGEATGGAGALKLLSLVVNLSTSALTVMGKVLQGLIRLIADLVIGIRESIDTVGTFFDFLRGEATWEDVKANAKEAGGAFKDLGQNFITSVGAVYETVRNEIETFAGDTEELTADLNANIQTSFQNTRDNVRTNWGEMVTGQKDLVTALNDASAELVTGVQNQNDDIKDDTDETVDELEATWEDYFDSINQGFSSVFSSIGNLSTMAYQNEKDRLDLALQEQLDDLEEKRQQGIITEENYEAQKESIEAEALEKSNALAEKQFESQKKFQTAQVWIDTAGAIVGWWRAATRLGPIAGPIFGGVMTAASLALAAAQTALIAQQVFVPSRQQGGMTAGATRVNEAGGEIITLPDGSQVIPNDISRQIADNIAGTGNNINVSFAGAKISDEMDLNRVTDQVIKKLGRELRLAV